MRTSRRRSGTSTLRASCSGTRRCVRRPGSSGRGYRIRVPIPATTFLSPWWKPPSSRDLPSRGDRTRTCNPRFWRPVRYQLRHAPGLRDECTRLRSVALCGEDAAVRARGAVHGDRGVARAPRAMVGPLRRARVGRRVRGGSRRPLDGGSRTTGLAKPIGPIWPSRQDEIADPRRILLGWVRRPSDRVTPNPDERALRGGHADAVAGLSRHA